MRAYKCYHRGERVGRDVRPDPSAQMCPRCDTLWEELPEEDLPYFAPLGDAPVPDEDEGDPGRTLGYARFLDDDDGRIYMRIVPRTGQYMDLLVDRGGSPLEVVEELLEAVLHQLEWAGWRITRREQFALDQQLSLFATNLMGRG